MSPFDSAEEVLLTAEGVGLGLRFLNYEVEKNVCIIIFLTCPSHFLTPIYRPFFVIQCSTEVLVCIQKKTFFQSGTIIHSNFPSGLITFSIFQK